MRCKNYGSWLRNDGSGVKTTDREKTALDTEYKLWIRSNYGLEISNRELDFSVRKSLFKDGAYYCYCTYVLRISRYSDFLLLVLINTGYFCAVQNYAEKAELKKWSWYPKRKLGVTTHFSEIIELQFGKERHTLLFILKLFTNIVYSLSSKNAWLPPSFFLDFCFSRIFSKPRKNTFELVATVLKSIENFGSNGRIFFSQGKHNCYFTLKMALSLLHQRTNSRCAIPFGILRIFGGDGRQ